MTAKWNTSTGSAAATSDDIDVAGAALINGVNTAITRYAGTSDPSTAAPSAWGANEIGAVWLDTTDADTVVTKQWQRLTAAPTYGWRTLKTPKFVWLTTPVDAVASTTSGSDVAYTDVDLTATLDASVQDAGQVLPVVRAVCLRVYSNCTTGAIPAGNTGYVAVREKGSTNEVRVHAQVAAKPVYQQVWVGLDSGEAFQYAVDTNASAVTMSYEIKVMGCIELV
jgi:hypothetical protein